MAKYMEIDVSGMIVCIKMTWTSKLDNRTGFNYYGPYANPGSARRVLTGFRKQAWYQETDRFKYEFELVASLTDFKVFD